MSLLGYDDHKQEFKFINSWGRGWGDGGFGYIEYRTFESTWVEGWVMNATNEKFPKKGQGETKFRNWDMQDCLGGGFYCIEIIGPNSERIAWLFAVERDEFLDIEELFVRPEHRNKGHARLLVRALHDGLAMQLGKEIRYWVSFPDTAGGNLLVFKRLIAPFGLSLKKSKVRWAAYEASKGLQATLAEARTKVQAERPASPFWPLDEQ